MKRLDPHATFSFADCEVDGFATQPRPTVPPYAESILRAAGLDPGPRPVELYPDPRTDAKPAQDLDGPDLLRQRIPLPEEPAFAEPPGDEPPDEVGDDPRPGRPIVVERTEPPIVLEPRESRFVPPSPEVRKRESEVAKPILLAFLRRHDDVFGMGRSQLAAGLPVLHLEGYRVARFFRAATFSQSVAGEPVLESRTQTLFDANWNVIGITRALYTPRKLSVRHRRVIARRVAVVWSRWYFQWMKAALNELGALPASAADYPKTTVIANACIDDIGYANSSLEVTIQHDEGEGEGKVRLADLCRQGNAACAASDYDPSNSGSFFTCEGGGCQPTPSVIHHELDTFINSSYCS